MTVLIDDAWANLKEDFVGLLGWRVENFKLEPVEELGKFHTGDSYVIFHAYTQGNSKRINRDIYFWLGSESSTDERGTAAKKTVELDDFFGGQPTQHREVQYHETEQFLRLFDKTGGIQYLDGGVPSGFRKVITDKTVDMYMVKGKRIQFVMQVPAQRSSLCQGNCYIIHTPGEFYLFIGKKASMLEKNKAVQSLDIMKSRDPKAKVERLEGETCPGLDALIGAEGEIAEDDGDDAQFEKDFKRVLYDSNYNVIAEGNKVARNLLPHDQISYLRFGFKIFAHIGKNAPKDAKRNAITTTTALMEKLGMPDYTQIEVLQDGSEDDDFDCVFQ